MFTRCRREKEEERCDFVMMQLLHTWLHTKKDKNNWDKLIQFPCPESKLLREAQRVEVQDEESCWRKEN